MSGVLEPPVNDLWTVPGEEGALALWKAEDEAFFKTVDATWWFFARQIEDFAAAVREWPPARGHGPGRPGGGTPHGGFQTNPDGPAGRVRPRA
ncbi:MAG: hypothetical protein M0C28_23370 [Candidatus Moduliflexus flocculans]|nr:hypothetical protein [Candidatus Moduliflexus flocculans]